MVLDLLGEHLHLGVEEVVALTVASLDLRHQQLGGIVLDIGFLKHVLVDLSLACRIEDFFFDLGVNRKLQANAPRQRFLAALALCSFEVFEELLDGTMIILQQRNGILVLTGGHGWSS